jgi:predicted DsbA family dithiol-disulfide isomerase
MTARARDPAVVLTRRMQIEIWSDVVCPWCYIGSTNLRRALAEEQVSAQLRFRSFQLDPNGPTEPVRTLEYLTTRYGPQAAAMMDQVTEVAARAGLEYHLEESWSGPTLDAHRLLHHAWEQGAQDALAQRFFAAQFTEGRSLFEADSLVELAAESGLEPSAARAVLDSDAHTADVAEDIELARSFGVTGVPFFVFDRRLAVSGAQAPEVFRQVFAQV